jgi:hypothetical protein
MSRTLLNIRFSGPKDALADLYRAAIVGIAIYISVEYFFE